MAEVLTKEGELSEVDRELEEIIKKHAARVKVVGCGGGGGNSVTRMKETGIKGCDVIAVNTDAQDLLYTNADSKILIGRELTQGLGAGSNPKIGEQAAKESEMDIKQKIEHADLVFVTCGLGGGTGSGCAPVVAELAKRQGALTIGIVTLPFTVEGLKRTENAQYGLERLAKSTDTLIVVQNDKLLDLAPELPIHTAFKVADEILTNAVKGITELITKAGLVNVDFADVKAIMSNGGMSLIGIGESESDNRAKDAVERAIRNPLLDIDITNASGVLVNVIGGTTMSLGEYKTVMELISKKVAPDAKIISGAQIVPEMDKQMKVLLIVTGIKDNKFFNEVGEVGEIGEMQKEGEGQEIKINFIKDKENSLI